jgi:predicted site-specific integrase-resolvase
MCASNVSDSPSRFNQGQGRWLRVSQVAQRLGISDQTVRNYCDNKILVCRTVPGSTHRRIDAHSVVEFETGEYPVDDTERKEGVGVGKLIIVCRVSSPRQNQKNDEGQSSLTRQEDRLKGFCQEKFGRLPDIVLSRQASSFNYGHPVFLKFVEGLCDGSYKDCQIVVQDPSRLLRYGAKMIERIASIHNNKIIYMFDKEDEDDNLAEEILSCVGWFSARQNGKSWGRISEIILQPDDLRRAYLLRLEGHSFQSIAKILQGEGRKDEKGRTYSDTVVRKQLLGRWQDLVRLYDGEDRETSFALFARTMTKRADDSFRVVRKTLLVRYRAFCKDRGLVPISKNFVGAEIKRLGWKTTRSNQQGVQFIGLVMDG